MKSYLKTARSDDVGLCGGNDLYSSVASLKANYRRPVSDTGSRSGVGRLFTTTPNVPTGGYWVIKNSWGRLGRQRLHYIPYGNIENHNDVNAITGPVYYTGSLATATWSGGAGTWAAGDSTKWSGYAWENKETSATFGGTGGAVTVSGTVIAHGMTINSDRLYLQRRQADGHRRRHHGQRKHHDQLRRFTSAARRPGPSPAARR